ncbi:hypothetical protein HBI12_197110 [Parastagonospora nodorum]|nr:hypothetical protein HBI12_197110 [Parastagonospora nodorum]
MVYLSAFKFTELVGISIPIIACTWMLYSVLHRIHAALFGPLSTIPGPLLRSLTGIPEVIDTLQGRTAPHDLPKLHAKYGPVVRTAPTKLSYLGTKQAWQEIYGFKTNIDKDPNHYRKAYNGKYSIVGAPKDIHAHHRKALSHSFSETTLRQLEPLIARWVARLVDRLYVEVADGRPIDMLKWYNCTTFDITGDMIFSEDLNMLGSGEYSTWVQTIFDSFKSKSHIVALTSLGGPIKWVVNRVLTLLPSVQKSAAEHWRYTKERVDRRFSTTPERPDLWTELLRRGDKAGLEMEDYYANAAILLIGGSETTASALSGTTYSLVKNPECLQKLVEEVRSKFRGTEDLTIEALLELPYLKAVLQEGMRMYPPAAVTLERVVLAGGATIYGQHIPEGTSVGIANFATMHSPEFFHKPDEFHPERWLNHEDFKNDHLEVAEFFLTGPRKCLGVNLAWHELRFILASMVLNFDIKLCSESEGWLNQSLSIFWEKTPLYCRLEPVKYT